MNHPTDEELDALVGEIAKLAWSKADVAVDAITALRAQLAEMKADRDKSLEARLAKAEADLQAMTLLKENYAAMKDRAEAERAAQIEADDLPPFHFDRYINGVLMAEGVTINKEPTIDSAMMAASRIASKGTNGEVPVLVYRARPHDRTALDRMLAEAEARGYEIAKAEAARAGWHLRRYDLAKRDAELANAQP